MSLTTRTTDRIFSYNANKPKSNKFIQGDDHVLVLVKDSNQRSPTKRAWVGDNEGDSLIGITKLEGHIKEFHLTKELIAGISNEENGQDLLAECSQYLADIAKKDKDEMTFNPELKIILPFDMLNEILSEKIADSVLLITSEINENFTSAIKVNITFRPEIKSNCSQNVKDTLMDIEEKCSSFAYTNLGSLDNDTSKKTMKGPSSGLSASELDKKYGESEELEEQIKQSEKELAACQKYAEDVNLRAKAILKQKNFVAAAKIIAAEKEIDAEKEIAAEKEALHQEKRRRIEGRVVHPKNTPYSTEVTIPEDTVVIPEYRSPPSPEVTGTVESKTLQKKSATQKR